MYKSFYWYYLNFLEKNRGINYYEAMDHKMNQAGP